MKHSSDVREKWFLAQPVLNREILFTVLSLTLSSFSFFISFMNWHVATLTLIPSLFFFFCSFDFSLSLLRYQSILHSLPVFFCLGLYLSPVSMLTLSKPIYSPFYCLVIYFAHPCQLKRNHIACVFHMLLTILLITFLDCFWVQLYFK